MGLAEPGHDCLANTSVQWCFPQSLADSNLYSSVRKLYMPAFVFCDDSHDEQATALHDTGPASENLGAFHRSAWRSTFIVDRGSLLSHPFPTVTDLSYYALLQYISSTREG